MFVYFVTFNAFMRKHLLQSDHSAQMVVDVMLMYRDDGRYLLHEFVVMPDHIHLMLSPRSDNTLPKCIQLIKGTVWGRRRRDFNFRGTLWQASFNDHRIRDFNEYAGFRTYIHQNPVKRRLVSRAEDYPYSSASGKYRLDPEPKEIDAFLSVKRVRLGG